MVVCASPPPALRECLKPCAYKAVRYRQLNCLVGVDAMVARQVHALVGPPETLRDEIRRLAGAKGVDVVFDPVGGGAFEVALRVAGALARVVVIGFASGTRPTVPANILLVKNVDVLGFYFGRYVWDGIVPRLPWDAEVADAFAHLFRWYEAGLLKPTIDRVFDFDEVVEAHRYLETQPGNGRVVISVPQDIAATRAATASSKIAAA